MATKIIQVPMDTALLKRVSQRSRRGFKSRADFIRLACEHYLQTLDLSDAERRYAEGYLRFPEDDALARSSSKAAAAVLPKEDWT